MATLQSLPPELFYKILDELPRHWVAMLSRVNRQFNKHVEPVLFRSIDWKFSNPNEADVAASRDEDSLVIGDDLHRMLLLFRSIYENHMLASHVQRLRITEELYDGRDSIDEPFTLNSISYSDLERFQNTITADLSDFPYIRHLQLAIELKDLDSLMAIFLSGLNNLRSLQLNYSIAFRLQLTGHLLKHYKSKFLRMDEIAVWNNDGRVAAQSMHWDSRDFPHPFLVLPFTMQTMKTIEMVLPDPGYRFIFNELTVERFRSPEAAIIDNLLCLTTLRLLNSQASVDAVGQILDYTPNLEVLEYNFVQDLDLLWFDTAKTRHHLNEWQQLATHLRKVSATLKELIISLSFYYLEDQKPEEADPVWVFGVWERRGWLKDINFLTKLERIEIPWAVILGFTPDFPNKKLRDVLPDNIHELCIRDDLVNTPKDILYTYQWYCMERKLTESIPNITGACGPIIEQLQDYFSGKGKSLRRLVMLIGASHQRKYSLPAARLSQILDEAGVEGRVHLELEKDADSNEDILMRSRLRNPREVSQGFERPKTLEVDYF